MLWHTGTSVATCTDNTNQFCWEVLPRPLTAATGGQREWKWRRGWGGDNRFHTGTVCHYS